MKKTKKTTQKNDNMDSMKKLRDVLDEKGKIALLCSNITTSMMITIGHISSPTDEKLARMMSEIAGVMEKYTGGENE